MDLNRNYGAYWGGSGSSNDATTQGYRGPSPYSEPESEAVHRFTSGLQVVTFITNHTFTADGKFLRQPGFDDVIALAPDEAPMKALGDQMAAATGWTSELGYATLGDITGATEDWNYFAQGTFGYTPEARGTNFHANYADSVIGEYDGSQAPSGGGRLRGVPGGRRAGREPRRALRHRRHGPRGARAAPAQAVHHRHQPGAGWSCRTRWTPRSPFRRRAGTRGT